MMAGFTAHEEHVPRPAGDPDYVPYWAKGEYARKNGTKYTTESGVTIEAGRVTEGSPGRQKEVGLYKYRADPQKRSEAPPVKPEVVRKEPDRVARMLKGHKTPEARLKLCARYGIDPNILTGAPNPGVASMRLANALRKVMS